jgi:hypothetical protein
VLDFGLRSELSVDNQLAVFNLVTTPLHEVTEIEYHLLYFIFVLKFGLALDQIVGLDNYVVALDFSLL